jgi:hypothetical protein
VRVTIEKKTDQLNFEDFLGGVTRTVTIAGVKKGTKEQQYDIAIEGDSRVWRPAVTVLKQLVEAWGDDATKWVGRRATLYGDPDIKFGPEKVGGIRVSHVSHIDKPLTSRLSITRGKRSTFTLRPLPDAPTEPTAEQVAASTDQQQLRDWWHVSSPERKAQIEARGAELKGGVS